MRLSVKSATVVLALALAGCGASSQVPHINGARVTPSQVPHINGARVSPPAPAAPPPVASSPESTWSVACRVSPVIEPSGGKTGSGGTYTVTLTNNTSDVQVASDILAVFLYNGRELESGGTTGPGQVLGGQTMTVSDSVPGTNPNYGVDSMSMNVINQCQVTGVEP